MSERDKAVEAMTEAVKYAGTKHEAMAEKALTALLTLHPSLASVLDGTGVVVPVETLSKWSSKLSAALGEKPGA